MIQCARLITEGGDADYSYQCHLIDHEDKLSQLIALEQQLDLTEQRFRILQNYVGYIRNLYHGSVQDSASIQLRDLSLTSGAQLEAGDSKTPTPSNEDIVKLFKSTDGKSCNALTSGSAEDLSGDQGYRKKRSKKKTKKKSKKITEQTSKSHIGKTKLSGKEMSVYSPSRASKRETRASSGGYLSPTMSFQMKTMKTYQPNFNFKSIPFVAGKATTRSHNLGVKIQETLSIIKRNTPMEVGRGTEQDLTVLWSQKAVSSPSAIKCHQDQDMSSRSKLASKISLRTKKDSSCSLISRSQPDIDAQENAETNSCLKKALLYIQSDFTNTLNEYKSLSKRKDPATADKLIALEESLDRKEEVIIAFSKLYNQVVSLRKQVREAEHRKARRKWTHSTLGNVVNQSNTKLIRLLRRIQDFQNKMQGYQSH